MRFRSIGVHVETEVKDTRFSNRALLLTSPLISTYNYRRLTREPELWDCSMLAAVDLPGFGLSDCGSHVPYGANYFSNLLWGVLDDLDGVSGQTWHLIAHGAACRFVIRMANAYPDSVKSVICLSPLLSKTPYPYARHSQEAWYERNIVNSQGFRRFYTTLAARDMLSEVLFNSQGALLHRGSSESLAKAFSYRPDPEKLNSFTPSMVLFGGSDPLMDKNARRALSECLPNSEVHELGGVGHLMMETHSRALSDFLRGWMKFIG